MNNNNLGCVYFFRHIGLSPVKIGYSSQPTPETRFTQFKTFAPYGAEIIGIIQSYEADKLEREIHGIFAGSRVFGEWFEISPDDVDSVVKKYSDMFDIDGKNDALIEWSKRSAARKLDNIRFGEGVSEILDFDKFKKYYLENNNLNISSISKIFGVSRTTIYRWIKDIQDGK